MHRFINTDQIIAKIKADRLPPPEMWELVNRKIIDAIHRVDKRNKHIIIQRNEIPAS